MKLSILAGEYSVLRFAPAAPIPGWVSGSAFSSVTRTAKELSIVVETRLIEPGFTKSEDGFAAIEVEGPLDFALTGILASLAAPLAKAGISIFAISTFDTDYLLVRSKDLAPAKAALQVVGFQF